MQVARLAAIAAVVLPEVGSVAAALAADSAVVAATQVVAAAMAAADTGKA
jgi:hypothetical protein